MPIVQRRSKPVNGRVLTFSLFVVVVGVVVVGVDFVGSVAVVGVLFSFDGDVPVVGVGFAGSVAVVGVVFVAGVVVVVGGGGVAP
jgi:hypothetical protein